MSYGVASSLSQLSLYVIPKRALQEFKGSQRLFPPFRGKTPWIRPHLVSPEGNRLDSHMMDWKHLVHRNTLTMVGRTIVARYNIKPTTRKVAHPGTIPTLGSSALKLPWDPLDHWNFYEYNTNKCQALHKNVTKLWCTNVTYSAREKL